MLFFSAVCTALSKSSSVLCNVLPFFKYSFDSIPYLSSPTVSRIIELNLYPQTLLYLLSFESGYLRYDHDEDENREDPILHPVDHIDLFYSSNSTFKIGLQDRIDVDDLKSILSINEKCYSINYHRDKR